MPDTSLQITQPIDGEMTENKRKTLKLLNQIKEDLDVDNDKWNRYQEPILKKFVLKLEPVLKSNNNINSAEECIRFALECMFMCMRKGIDLASKILRDSLFEHFFATILPILDEFSSIVEND
ncbi:MAG: hypothetical protein MHPSP_004419, partial [Paramarteilia canceri]